MREEEKVEEVQKEEFVKSDTFIQYKEERDKYKTMKESIPKKGSSREAFTLQLLSKFKEKLSSAKEKSEDAAETSKTLEEGEEGSDTDETNW